MLRIISGHLKSRLFKASPAMPSRPMGDKVKMALFNMLGDISGKMVLDAYGGSGGLAFEALSRGARHVTCLERNVKTYTLLIENASKLGLSKQVLWCQRINNLSYVKSLETAKFDLILLDPPYDEVVMERLLVLSSSLKSQGVLALSYPKHFHPEFNRNQFELLTRKSYAQANLVLLQKH